MVLRAAVRAVLVVGLSATLLAACGGGDDESGSTVPKGDRTAYVELMQGSLARYVGDPAGNAEAGVELQERAQRLVGVLEEDREADFEYLCTDAGYESGFIDVPVAAALAGAAASVDRVDPALGDAIRRELMRLGLPTEASPLCGLGK